MKNIIVLVSGNGSNLQAIIDACVNNKINAKISAVISNKDGVYALERAKDAQINTHILLTKNFTSKDEYDKNLIKIIDKVNPDLIILAGFMRILTPLFVNHYLGKIINIHPSLLPKYPGLNTHQKALEAKDKKHGASVHFVTAELDAGPIILQGKFNVLSEDTIETVTHKVHQLEHLIYPTVIKWFCDERLMMKQERAYLDNNIIDKHGLDYHQIS